MLGENITVTCKISVKDMIIKLGSTITFLSNPLEMVVSCILFLFLVVNNGLGVINAVK